MRKSILRSSDGASAVEFAALSPILILFVFGAAYFGVYLSLAHSIQQLSADAARASIAGLDDDERRRLSVQHVATSAGSYFLIKPDKVSVEAAASAGDPTAFRVTVRYDAHDILSWYPRGLLPGLDTNIQRASIVPNGGAE